MPVTAGATDSGSVISSYATGFKTSACVKAPCCSPAQRARLPQSSKKKLQPLCKTKHHIHVSAPPWQPRSIIGQVLSKTSAEASTRQDGAAQQVPVHEHAAQGWRWTNLRTSRGWSWLKWRMWKSKRRELKHASGRDAVQLPRFNRHTQKYTFSRDKKRCRG